MAERARRILPNMPNGEIVHRTARSEVRARSAERREAVALGPSPTSRFEPRRSREVIQSESLAWALIVAPERVDLLDRANPAAVVVAILAGFGFAVGVGSIWFG